MKALPQELLRSLQGTEGFDEAAFIKAHTEPSVTSLRLHPIKGGGRFEDSNPVPWCKGGKYLAERPVFTLDPAFHAGAYYVQEASSMFLDYMVRQLLPERDNLRVLDLCAAPGGKSTLLASLLPSSALLISNEVIRTRASILEENVVRWGYTNNWVTSNDPKDFGKLKSYFDLIVVDAPCSGSGLFRKDERALDEWSEANVQLCCQRQQRILADVWDALKEDGILIYATCSYSPQEDEQILEWLSADFEVAALPVPISEEWGIVSTTAGELTGYRFFPHKVKGEGLFIAAVQKKESTGTLKQPKWKSLHDAKAFAQAKHLVKNGDWACLPLHKDAYHAIYTQQEADYHILKQHVYLRTTGLLLGAPAGKDWVPAHDVALSVDRSESLPSVSLTKEQALRFLKKEDVQIPLTDKGWLLMDYDHLGLGWVKSLGNRYNNYLPKHWRIRMELPGEDWA